jgi:LysM repeat protein
MRSRVLGATVAALLTAVAFGACADMDDGAAEQTLPAIQTTTIVTTTLPPTTTQPRFYEIQSGDTLIEIAAAFGLPVQAIMEANGIADANRILAGQILTLPLASEIVVTSLPPVTTTPQPTAGPAVTTIGP